MRNDLLTLWPDEQAVNDCIKHEAETQDKAVFLAVHQPMRFVRVEQGGKAGTGQICTEQELLAQFLERDLPEGRVILPIEGSSGVGKSHVIRWIDAQLERRPDRDTRHVIRVPKGMSLKGVLRLLLDRLDGPRYDELREQLTGARERLDPELAAKLLIVNVAHRLEKEGAAAAERLRDGRGNATDRMLKSYGDKRALPALIGDSELLHSHWLADGQGVMARLAEQVTEEAVGPEDARQHQIRAEDLQLPTDLVEKLNRTSQKFYQMLGTGDRLSEAARLINRVLDPAKQDLLQLGDGSLTDLFRAVRAQLYQDGKELVFLVEDFAVLSGMQGALLQVMITEAFRDGEQVLCTMRSALAYTEGVAHVPETVRTRARHLWTIEDQPGQAEEIHRRVVELVGAYLNAARVGKPGLQAAFEAAESQDQWVPAHDGVDLEDEAKGVIDAFGRSDAGYPLFPFNAAAIRQLTEQGSRKNGALVFNPRNVINNVLGKVLRERNAFQRNRFPHKEISENVRSSAVVEALRDGISDREQQLRALTLLGCWGDQPETVQDAAVLPVAVFEAFGLVQPAWRVTVAGSESPRTTRAQPKIRNAAPDKTGTETELPVTVADPAEKRWRAALEGWATGQLLGQADAALLRKWLAQAMLEFGAWDKLPLKVRHNAGYLQKFVFLPRARGQGGLEPESAFLQVAGEADLDDPFVGAGIVRSLLAFVRLYEVNRDLEYPEALNDAALVGAFLDARLERAELYLRSHHFRSAQPTVPALTEALLVGARALGGSGADSRQLPHRVSALFCDTEPPDEPLDTAWGAVLHSFAEHRAGMRTWLLEQIGARQGGGAVHAVDVTAVHSTIRQVASTWSITHKLTTSSTMNSEFKAAATELRKVSSALPKALRQQRQELLAWHSQAVDWFGPDPDKQDLRDALRETVTEARKTLPQQFEYKSLRQQIAALKDISLKAALADCARLEESEKAGDILSVLARRPHRAMRAAQQLMNEFDLFLELYNGELESRLGQLGEDAVTESAGAVRAELRELQNQLQTIQGAGS